MKEIQVIKKDNSVEPFMKEKLFNAVGKSAERVLVNLTDEQLNKLERNVKKIIIEKFDGMINVKDLHNVVEVSLTKIDKKVAESYRSYRNYKTDFISILDNVYQKAQSVLYIGDKENSNADSSLVSTKRSLITGVLMKELYQKTFLSSREIKACKDGFIYIHDMRDRLLAMNCCLADVGSIMKDGFEMGNVWYNEPKTVDTACDVLGDIIMSMASQEYGGYTVAEIDKVLAPYCEKSYRKHKQDIEDIIKQSGGNLNEQKISCLATSKTRRELEQGIQGLEIKLNTVASSRGDYIFTTFSFGIGQSKFERMVSETILKVRREGQGKQGFKRQMLFPKLVFLYDEELHGEGKQLEYLFDEAVLCSSKSMYPDFLSLSGDGYVPEMYKKYGRIVSPMGCRAFLSPWYENGGMRPQDENDKPIFVSRFNIGAITLNLCMIYQESKVTGEDFYKLLDYYLEMIRQIHIRTYHYLANLKASTNPLGFTQGGFLNGHLDYNDKIGLDVLRPMTASFGFTALNELCLLHNGKTIREDNTFAVEVIDYILDKINLFKEEDGWLYALYGTPAESLVGLQVEQFKNRFGLIEGIFDKKYVSNSFHLHVSEDVTPFEKQDGEYELFHKATGGRITYTKYPIDYNLKAIKDIIRRGMEYGFYQGVNLSLSYCNNCGHQQLDMNVCPECGSDDVTKIERMNGYLSYTKVKGDTRLNDAKMEEISDRKSM